MEINYNTINNGIQKEVSSSQSGKVIEVASSVPVIDDVVSEAKGLNIANFLVRKSAHMFLFFTLEVILFLAVFMYITIKIITNKKIKLRKAK